MISTKKQYRVYVLNKLASYFGARKAALSKEVKLEEDELLMFPSLEDEHGFDDELYVTHLDKLKLLDLLSGKKFSKTDIYDEFHNGFARLPIATRAYRMVVHMVGMYWVVYRDVVYDGLGGIYVKCEDGFTYVIEPLDNYLKYNYPHTEID